MGKPVHVDGDNFQSEVLEFSGTPVLVDFWSETCGHCLALNPQYDQAADDNEAKVKFVKVSFQADKDLFKDHGVRATPTLVLFGGGKEISRKVGAMRADDLTAGLDENLPE